MTWWEVAACRGMDPELFMPDPQARYHPDAIATCTNCPVTHECIEEGLRIHPEAYDQGWRAGTTQKDRIRIRRTRNRTRKNAA